MQELEEETSALRRELQVATPPAPRECKPFWSVHTTS